MGASLLSGVVAPHSCPSCQAPVPTSLSSCPVCGYAGVMGPVGLGWLNGAARFRKSIVAVVLGSTLLFRCGVAVLTNADDVAQVADLVGDIDDLRNGDGGDSDSDVTLAPRDVSPEYAAADASFVVVFPEDAPVSESSDLRSDGTRTLTLHQGDWHLRQIVVPADVDDDPATMLPRLAADLPADLGGEIVSEEPTELLGMPAEHVVFTFAGREADAIVVGRNGRYYELWHTPGPTDPADVSPLVESFVAAS